MAADDKKLAKLKNERDTAIRAAQKAAYAYFCECPVGPERIKAGEIYSNVRTSVRVGVTS